MSRGCLEWFDLLRRSLHNTVWAYLHQHTLTRDSFPQEQLPVPDGHIAAPSQHIAAHSLGVYCCTPSPRLDSSGARRGIVLCSKKKTRHLTSALPPPDIIA